MCGIAGFTRFLSPIGDITTLQNMGNAIAHRGPDASGEYLDEHVGLCHRRLSIIDLSEAGQQPMFSTDKQLAIVFNGEIYNFQSLREELVKNGYIFQSKTDTEVILALYQREGPACLNKLNGMFAFALWDKQKQRLFLARDRIGKKPLYYLAKDGHFAFASEIKALLKLPNFNKNINYNALYDFFAYQYIPDPKTIFKDIYKLEPGFYLTITAQSIHKQQYWNLSFDQTSHQSEGELKEQLLQLIQSTTQARMISDVPLGAFLSGGIDSSGVVGIMSQLSTNPVTTCSIGFDDKKYDEIKFAKIVANQYKTNHHEFTVRKTVEDHLKHIVSFFDEPFADPSLVPTYFVCELARKQVTVALAGDGGDEVFAGYEKYSIDAIENQLRNYFPNWIRSRIFPRLAKLLTFFQAHFFRKGHTLLNSLSADPAMGFYLSNAQMTNTHWHALINNNTRVQLGDYHPSQITTQFYHNAKAEDHLAKILYTDIKTYLPGDILVKVDRMSMAHSLEVRAPLLDYQMMEFAARIPSFLKFKHGEKKYILKEALKPILPTDILYRKKMGFSVPLAHWLRYEIKELSQQALLNPHSGLANFFNTQNIHTLWDQHQSSKQDHSHMLWSLLMFELWFQRYM